MNKRGISPLIASVLLIAFTIILFATITLWIRNSAVNPAMQETEEKVASDLEAMSTSIKIENAELSGNNIKLTVSNIGSTLIKGFSVRVIGSNGVDIVQVEQELNELDSVTKDIQFNISKTSSIENIEVIPILASGLAISATTSETGLKDKSLIAYYAFEGNANDLSGNGNSGVIYGADCNVNGRIGKACSFDGVDDYIAIVDNPNLDNTPEISVCSWIYPKGVPATSGTIVNKKTSIYRLRIEPSMKLTLALTTDNNSWAYAINQAGNALTLNAWNYVCFTYKSGSTIIYLNGIKDSNTSAFTGDIADGSQTLDIGYEYGLGNYFNGTIDEVKIYNRALSEEEIKALAG